MVSCGITFIRSFAKISQMFQKLKWHIDSMVISYIYLSLKKGKQAKMKCTYSLQDSHCVPQYIHPTSFSVYQ